MIFNIRYSGLHFNICLLILLFAFMLASMNVIAKNADVKGIVYAYNQKGKSAVKSVRICIDGDFNKMVQADRKGNFRFQLSKGIHSIRVKKNRYRTLIDTFSVCENTFYDVRIILIPENPRFGQKQSTFRIKSIFSEPPLEHSDVFLRERQERQRKKFVKDNALKTEKQEVTHDVLQEVVSEENNDNYTEKKRLALVIGNDEYENAGILSNSVNDASGFANVLDSLGFEVTLEIDCTQKEMKTSIDEFCSLLDTNTVGLFYYAGHGIQFGGYNYLVPVDANLTGQNQIEYDCVCADRVLSGMEQSQNATNIIILDACRDNPFESIGKKRSVANTGLAFMNAPSGSLIAYSTSPGNVASDGYDQNSLYTSALLECIKIPNITILQMFQKVRRIVKNASNGKQTTWESTSLEGDFYFAK